MVGAEPDELLDKNVFGDWIEVLIGAFDGLQEGPTDVLSGVLARTESLGADSSDESCREAPDLSGGCPSGGPPRPRRCVS